MKAKLAVFLLILLFATAPQTKAQSLADVISQGNIYISATITVCEVGWEVYITLKDNFWHDWWYIRYADGTRVYNRFKRKRTAAEILVYFSGQGAGDCDAFSGGRKMPTQHCFPDNVGELYKQHGKIVSMGKLEDGPPDYPNKGYIFGTHGTGIALFADAGFTGRHTAAIWQDIPDLRTIGFNDTASSLWIKQPFPLMHLTYVIWLYTDINFKGDSMLVDADYSNLGKTIHFNDNVSSIRIKKIKTTDVTSSQIDLPTEIKLFQNYPNPFNPETQIRYSINQAGNVNLLVYEISGKEIITLVDEHQNNGVHTIVWDGRDSIGRNVSSGIYLYRLFTGGQIFTKKMSLVR
ncbi:MAG: T9SS type A sorting domain-containing protein [Deferribacteres bacterium]|nr:T9SS type A sorting domain-containing protein [Deferribacteres bacterium]